MGLGGQLSVNLGLKEGVGVPFGVFVGVRLFFRGKQLRPRDSTGHTGKRLVRKPCIRGGEKGRSLTCHKNRAPNTKRKGSKSALSLEKIY